jgi:hypothetical protein
MHEQYSTGKERECSGTIAASVPFLVLFVCTMVQYSAASMQSQ